MECAAIRQLRAEGRAEGFAEGIIEGGNIMLYNLVKSRDLSLSRAAELAKMSEEEFCKNASLCGIHYKE